MSSANTVILNKVLKMQENEIVENIKEANEIAHDYKNNQFLANKKYKPRRFKNR